MSWSDELVKTQTRERERITLAEVENAIVGLNAAGQAASDSLVKNLLEKAREAVDTPPEDSMHSISRITLEGLAARAGVEVSWHQDQPIFTISTVSPLTLNDRERVLERRLETLERENVTLRERVKKANFNQTASTLIDAPNRIQVLEEQVAFLKDEKERQEAEKLRAKGASDADIAATKKLLGGKTQPEEGSLIWANGEHVRLISAAVVE
jgi:hypothetical protein